MAWTSKAWWEVADDSESALSGLAYGRHFMLRTAHPGLPKVWTRLRGPAPAVVDVEDDGPAPVALAKDIELQRHALALLQPLQHLPTRISILHARVLLFGGPFQQHWPSSAGTLHPGVHALAQSYTAAPVRICMHIPHAGP